MSEDFRQKLYLTIIDKLVIAVLLLIAASWFNNRLKSFESQLTEQRLVSEERRAFVGRQLSEFYWPLYLRLQKDTVIWKAYPDAKDRAMGSILELKVLLPNRLEISKLIEEKVYLAHPDEALMNVLLKLLRHIAISEALHAQGSLITPYEMNKEYGWPDDEALTIVKNKTTELQKEYDSLIRSSR